MSVEPRLALVPSPAPVSPLARLRELTARLTHSERELCAERDAFRALFDAAFDGMVVHRTGSILVANHAFATMFGAAPADVEGSHLVGYFAADALDVVARHLCAAGTSPLAAWGRRRSDGVTFPLVLRDLPHKGPLRVAILRPVGGET